MSSTTFKTVNPHTGQKIKDHQHIDENTALDLIGRGQNAFTLWSKKSFHERCSYFEKLKSELTKDRQKIADLISLEMGKPLAQAVAEVDKSISLIEFVIARGPESLKTKKEEGYDLLFQPLGVIYGVMPWNFPIWQVVRFALPALMAGNSILLKHADNVAGTAALLGEIFARVFPDLFINLPIDHEVSNKVIADFRVRGVSLTGSTVAGRTIAAEAGKSLKKCVLELGGNDAYVVLPGADLEFAVQKTFEARLLNAGQSCISAKRLLVSEDKEKDVLELLKKKIAGVKTGDPFDAKVQMGPVARKDLKEKLDEQLKKSVAQGAQIYFQGELAAELVKSCYFPPTLLHKIDENNLAFQDEFFGPVFSVITYKDEADALRLANASKYGLGGAVFAKDEATAAAFAEQMETGSIALNDFFRSAPEKPFGGVKDSGYGRELGRDGFFEFVNVKTVIRPKTSSNKIQPDTLSAE